MTYVHPGKNFVTLHPTYIQRFTCPYAGQIAQLFIFLKELRSRLLQHS